MVLRPIYDSEPPTTPGCIPAWNAVENQQRANTSAWWLIAQPDHAALSGEIAAHFSAVGFPAVDTQIVHAVAMHDAGWNLFESDWQRPPRVHRDGRPLSFFEIEPQAFLRAWTASIDRAQEDSAAGAYMVSQHFASLGEFRLRRAEDPPEIQQQVRAFVADERTRQAELMQSSSAASSWHELLQLLQFCDLFSLYLCSGSKQAVEFPLAFAAGPMRACYERGTCVLSPSPFPSPWQTGVSAHRYPLSSGKATCRISMALK